MFSKDIIGDHGQEIGQQLGNGGLRPSPSQGAGQVLAAGEPGKEARNKWKGIGVFGGISAVIVALLIVLFFVLRGGSSLRSLELVKNPDPYVRARAAIELSKWPNDRSALKAVLALADDAEPYVRRWAVWSIGEIGKPSPAVAKALCIGLASGDKDIKRHAAIATYKLRYSDPQLVSALVTCVELADEDTAFYAIKALGQMKPLAANVIPHLARVIGKGGRLERTAFDSLGKLGAESIPVLVKYIEPRVGERCSDALVALIGIGPDAESARVAVTTVVEHGESLQKVLAKVCLARMNQDTKASVDEVHKIIKAAGQSERTALIACLGKGMGDDYVPIASGFLDDSFLPVRYMACHFILDRGKAALPQTPKLLAMERSESEGVDAWIKQQGADAIPYLKDCLHENQSKLRAAELLIVFPEIHAIAAEALADVARHATFAEKVRALWSLIELGSDAGSVRESIQSLIQEDQDPFVQAAGRSVLAATGVDRDKNIDLIVSLLLSTQIDERVKVAFYPFASDCLANCGPPAIPKLTDIVDKEAGKLFGPAGSAAKAIATMSRKHREAENALLTLVTHKDLLVRRAAILVLTPEFRRSEDIVKAATKTFEDSTVKSGPMEDAVVAVGMVGSPLRRQRGAVMQTLTTMSASGDVWIKAAAHFALARLAVETPRQIEALVLLLDANTLPDSQFIEGIRDKDQFREKVLSYLAAIGPEAESARGAVKDLQGTGEKRVSRAATEALRRISVDEHQAVEHAAP